VDPTPSGIDGTNSGGCSFTSPIIRVSVFLDNDLIGLHTETFHIEPPTTEIALPLPGGLVSEKTLESLAPGNYSRKIVATTADGAEWDITANHNAMLKNVRVEQRYDPGPLDP
jgi:hypothetical protein